MSSYIEFYVKAGDFYAPIYSETRSGAIYQAFQCQVPYENSRALTVKDLDEVRDDQQIDRSRLNEAIKDEMEKIEWLKSSNLPVEDRMEEYNSAREMVADYKEALEQTDRVLSFCNWLEEMMDEVRYMPDTCKRLAVDPDNYVFVGIDCGNPGFKDLED